jgi:iron complex outermembrane receptor protein
MLAQTRTPATQRRVKPSVPKISKTPVSTTRTIFSGSGVFLASLFSAPGLAQVQPSSDTALLEEVVVTAQRREQNLQDVGMSVTAFTGADLKDLGITSPQELSRHTPGLRFTLNANDDVSMTFSLRGVGLDDFSGFNEAPVAIYFDEVYQATLAGNNGQLYDIERVEILKGPQGTLYGRNTTGGIVHFISRRPTEEFDAYVDAAAGEYSLFRLEGAASGPLTPWLKGRLSAMAEDHDGYSDARLPGVRDSGTGGEYGARLQLLAEPTDRISVLLSTYYVDVDIIPTPYEHGSVTFLPDGVTDVFLPPDQPNPICPGAAGADCLGYQDRDGDPFAQDNDREKLSDLEKTGATATVNWEFDDFTLTSITAWHEVNKLYQEDADAGPVDGVKVDDLVDSRQWSQEFRLAGGSDPVRWTTGFYYFDRVVDSGPRVDLTGVGFITGRALVHDDIESWALFGQVEYDFLTEWTGIVGLRYTQDERVFNLQAIDESGLAVLFGFPPNPIIDFRRETVGNLAVHDDGYVTARMELNWRPRDEWLLYGSWSRGIKSAGFNQDPGLNGPRDPTTIPVDKEVLMAYEIGSKSTLLDGRARLNVAAFYYDYQDFQAFTFENLVNKLTNQDAEIVGFETELQAHPWERWDFRLGLALLDTNVEGLTRQNFFTGDTVALGDREMVLAPDIEVSGVARYEWPFWNGSLAVQGDFHYMAEHFLDIDNNPTSTEDAHLVGNASLTYADGDDRYSVVLWIQNIGDTEYRTFNGPITGNGYTLQQFGKPRWLGASLRVNF